MYNLDRFFLCFSSEEIEPHAYVWKTEEIKWR